MHDAKLDMRMNRTSELSAYDVVNFYTKEELQYIIKEYERINGRQESQILLLKVGLRNLLRQRMNWWILLKQLYQRQQGEKDHTQQKELFKQFV